MSCVEAYVGEKRKQIREGYGIYSYENKFFKYEGEWLNGKKQGHGKLQLADGTYYEGEFQNGEMTGHGFKYYANSGNTYSGEFLLGEHHGQGVMNYYDGSVYEGEWHRNKWQGYGVLRHVEDAVYQGYFHNHKRHGEGTQIYSNGERYDGDWVNGLRQGHGELRFPDTAVYDGQWRNDVRNGQGTMTHPSGVAYEGIWINGYPEKMATKIVLKDVEGPLEVTQGTTFSLDVLTVNENGDHIEEQGRVLQITAGFKYAPPKEKSTLSAENQPVGLFDMIEDVEEQLIETPFGYSIVNYPLTDNYRIDEFPTDGSFYSATRTRTDLSETAVPENEAVNKVSEGQKVFGPDGGQGSRVGTAGTATDVPPPADNVNREDTELTIKVAGENTSSDMRTPSQSLAGSALPPPVATQVAENGAVSFKNLVLPAAPPMYRPYMVQTEVDDEKKERKSRQGSKPSSRQSKREEEPDSRPSTKAKSANLGDERFARPGEYVIMVEEKTDPPFMGLTMETAYLLVKVVLPKKVRQRTSSSMKVSGPNSRK